MGESSMRRIWIVALWLFFSLPLDATSDDTDVAVMVVGGDNTLTIVNVLEDIGIDPSQAAIDGVNIFDVFFSNKSIYGFELNFTSLNAGALRLRDEDGVYDYNKPGTWMAYELEFVPDGVLASQGYSLTAGSLTNIVLGDGKVKSDQILRYTGSSAGVNSAFAEVKMSAPVNPNLFKGTYEDTIILTISNYSP